MQFLIISYSRNTAFQLLLKLILFHRVARPNWTHGTGNHVGDEIGGETVTESKKICLFCCFPLSVHSLRYTSSVLILCPLGLK
jgi:hypothetical protein